jgi:hypothetical protein
MKIALCFIISYDHILNKEAIWREWIEPNKDIINVYIYYKDLKKIKSPWILQHTLPTHFIHETSYYHVIPAYLSLMQFALTHDPDNQWICLLTDSCCPIISPQRFRSLFYKYWNNSIMSWKPAWWNVNVHKRANLSLLPQDLRLANDPWFTIKRENASQILRFSRTQQEVTKTICAGGLANESLFAIILYGYKQLNNTKDGVINAVTHLADWSRMASATSPHTFKEANATDIKFLEDNLQKHKCAMFLRKVSPDFPDYILKKYIYTQNDIYVSEPFIFIFRRWLIRLYYLMYYGLPLICLLYGFKYFLL